jgi:hypothetical protein
MRLGTLVAGALVAGALSACSPKSPDAPQLPQPTILTRTTVEGPSPECPVGGVRIDAGVDDGTPGGTARDGVLDPREIDTTMRICGAADAVVKVTAEPPGVHCSAGGSRVDVGVDDGSGGGIPGNGVLEAGEIDRTTWVCNGVPASCIRCHTGDASGASPIRDRHDIPERTQVLGLAVRDLSLSGGTGSGGTFRIGDVPTLAFTVVTGSGAVTDLKTNNTLSLTVTGAGPATAPQRTFAAATSKSALTAIDAVNGRYAFTLPAFPANALPPYNTTGGVGAPNVDGTYRIALYVQQTFSTFRDAAYATVDFPFAPSGLAPALRGRAYVTDAACDACHGSLRGHSGSRRGSGGWATCHTAGAEDRGVGAVGCRVSRTRTAPGTRAATSTGSPTRRCR